MPMIANQKDKGINIVLLHSLKSGKLIDEDIFSRENLSNPPSLTTLSRNMFYSSKADIKYGLLEFVEFKFYGRYFFSDPIVKT